MPKDYVKVCMDFMPGIVGKHVWEKRAENQEPEQVEFSKVVSVSDEACMLVMIENIIPTHDALPKDWYSWKVSKCREYLKSKEKGHPLHGIPVPKDPPQGSNKESKRPPIPGKHTRNWQSVRAFQGWSVDGKKRHNEWFDLVKRDRRFD